jgi:hypothetical protein
MDLATQWEWLGRELGYKDLQLKKLIQSVMAYLPLLTMQKNDLCFLHVLNSWITGDPEKYKKEVLVKALKATGYEKIAEETRRLYKGEPINSCINIHCYYFAKVTIVHLRKFAILTENIAIVKNCLIMHLR